MFPGLVAFIAGAAIEYSAIKGVTILDAMRSLLMGRSLPATQGFAWEHGSASPGGSGDPAVPASTPHGKAGLLVHLGHVAEQMGLHVSECDAPGAPAHWGPVHRVHAPNSLHYQHRAFDASGSEAAMHAFSQYVAKYTPEIAELIHNPGFAVKNGQKVSATVYAAVWMQHKGHVHVGV